MTKITNIIQSTTIKIDYMKKYALYVRVSTLDQTNENQKVRLIEFADQHGYEYDIYEEVESSRRTRPIKQALLQKLRNGVYSGCVVYKIDRWARSSTELILEIKELVDKGIAFISVSDNLDFSSATGRLHFQILAVFAEFERSLISDRTRSALSAIRRRNEIEKNGKCLGRPKGSKDKKARRKSGYILRHARERQESATQNGIHKPIQDYIDKL
jgi:putative DNA-invertase from lambdoid prophage Rac